MATIFSLIFLLTDHELLSDFLRWGQGCGLTILVVLFAAVAGGAFHRLIRRKKALPPADFS
jgi:hypothetical protein